MTRLYRSPISWWLVGALAIFIVGAREIPNQELLEGLRILQLTVAVTLTIGYYDDAWAALKTTYPDSVDFMTVGVFVGWFAQTGIGALSLLWRLGGQEPWLINSDLNAFFVFASVLSGILHALAPNALRGSIPRRNKLMVGAMAATAAVSFTAMVASRPDIRDLLERIKPFIAEDHARYYQHFPKPPPPPPDIVILPPGAP